MRVRLFGLMMAASALCACATAPKSESSAKAAPAATADAEMEMCQNTMCAFDAHIVLKRKDGTVFDKTFRSLPVVQPNGVSVYAGQKVVFEADLDGDRLVNLKLASSATAPEKTISAELTQWDDGQMALTMRHPFNRNLRVSMAIMPFDKETLFKTSSCPVRAGMLGIETWPYPVFQVWLTDMHLLGENESDACVE